MARRAQPAAELPPIDWATLLMARDPLPRQWWVSEAIARRTSDTELRAEAALTLLLEPEGKQIQPGSRMAQLLPVVKRYQVSFQSEAHFGRSAMVDGELPPSIYAISVDVFLRVFAASKAVNPRDRGCAPLVPELVEAARAAATVVEQLKARGLDKVPAELIDAWRAKHAGPAPAAASAPAAAPQTTYADLL